MWSKSVKLGTYCILLTTFDFMRFFSHAKNLPLQHLFVDGDHAEHCSMFVQGLLENKNQTTSDVIGQFYGWLVFAFTPLLVASKIFIQNRH